MSQVVGLAYQTQSVNYLKGNAVSVVVNVNPFLRLSGIIPLHFSTSMVLVLYSTRSFFSFLFSRQIRHLHYCLLSSPSPFSEIEIASFQLASV